MSSRLVLMGQLCSRPIAQHTPFQSPEMPFFTYLVEVLIIQNWLPVAKAYLEEEEEEEEEEE